VVISRTNQKCCSRSHPSTRNTVDATSIPSPRVDTAPL